MNFDEKFIEQLKSKNDIVDVISSYCNLSRKGGSYWACCPLPGHMEKTPSFSVNPTGQFYKCFGCGRGGDVIKFIMEMETMDFGEAVKFLANRAGLEVPSQNGEDEARISAEKRKKERLLAVLKESAHFYVNNLASPQAKAHRDYLEKRGIDRATQRLFGIGASTDYRTLPNFLHEKGYSYEEMLEAGVVSFNKERKEYSDFEANRLIIPIIDPMKNVIAFGGRVIVKTDFAKYKNTSETTIFVKNRCLYNLNNLKKAGRTAHFDYVIMVEGYMDTISLYTAGFQNVVASMGTSLTQQQAKLLKRYTDTVVISYDGDSAGQKATVRGLEILRDAGLTVKVVSLPDGLDPDDLIKQRGKAAYQKLIDDSLLLIDYKLQILKNRYDIKTDDGKRKFVDSAISVIRESEKSFEQEELLKKLSAMSGIAYEYLRRDLDRIPQKESQEAEEVVTQSEADTGVVSAVVTAERFVLLAILNKKGYATIDDICDYEFTDRVRTKICNYLVDTIDGGREIFIPVLTDLVGNDGLEELNNVLLAGENVFDLSTETKYYSDCVNTMKTATLNNDISELERLFTNEMDLEARRKIAELLQNKITKLKKIKTEDKQ